MTRAAALACCLLALPALARAQTPGWTDVDLGSGHRARRYLPMSVRACDPLPLLLFLHGAGGTPEAYESYLTTDAEALGLVLVLPLSTSAGWSGSDVPIINAALDAVGMEVNVDVTRTYIGGHSAGGAWAYILAYGSTGFAAVFTMSAPYYDVSSVADSYRAPIHMYFGDMDPNYTGGGAMALQAQWTSLGIPQETDLEVGFGHSNWPPSSIRAGLDFLLARRYPGTASTSECAGSDAAVTIDAALASDAGADAGQALDGATISSDAALASDAARRHVSTGCGCHVGTSRASTLPALALFALLLSRRRARG